jgi:hypothetical protein
LRGGLCCATPCAALWGGSPRVRMGCQRRQQPARRLEGTHAVVVPARQVVVSVGPEVTSPRSQVHRRTAQGHAACGLRDGMTSKRRQFGAPRSGRVWTRGPFRYKAVDPRLCYGLSSSLHHVWFLACWSLVGRSQLTSHDVCLTGDASTRALTQRACEEGKSKCHGLE